MRLKYLYTLLLCLIFNFAFSQKDTTQISQKYKAVNYTLYYYYFDNIDIKNVDTFNLINSVRGSNSITFRKNNNYRHRLSFNICKKYKLFYLKKGVFFDFFTSESYLKYYNEILYNTIYKIKIIKVEYKMLSIGFQLFVGKSFNRFNLEFGSNFYISDVLNIYKETYSNDETNNGEDYFDIYTSLHPQLNINYLTFKRKNIFINTSIAYYKRNYKPINNFYYGIGLTKQF